MSKDDGKLICYNRACGLLFDPAENTPESCFHHPGVPVFHDAYKKWSCCDKKTTDFTEFLNIKGCTKSYHSNIKPPEAPKPEAKEKDDKEEIYSSPKPLQQQEQIERPDINQPMIKFPYMVGASLKPVLEKMKKEIVLEKEEESDLAVQLNTPCHNKGCREVYKGEISNSETCMYHSGVPIFHEGMKYWSCCVRRTTDFDSFLEQIGCTTGKHKWHKDTNVENKTTCRYDWHQTGSSIVVSVYSKCPLPELSYVEANPVKLHIHVTFGKEKQVFDEQIILFGVIDVQGCNVSYLGTKVEIKMKKAHMIAWKDIKLKEGIMNLDNMSLDDN